MKRVFPWIAVVSFACFVGVSAQSQTAKKSGGGKGAAASYRTLTGKIMDLKAGEQLVTINVEAGKTSKAKGQTWILSVGNQTLLLQAGRNGQYSAMEFGDLKKGETIQAVAALEADPSDKSHNTWWLVHYGVGTTPPAR